MLNKKVYIGQSKNVIRRITNHKYKLNKGNHHNDHLQKAYNNDKGCFSFTVLLYCDTKSLNFFEAAFIKAFNSNDRKFGYNIELGGGDYERQEETRMKLSNILKGRKLSKEHVDKIRVALSKRKITDKTREKLSLWQKGSKKTEDHIKKISETLIRTSSEKSIYKDIDLFLKNNNEGSIDVYDIRISPLALSNHLARISRRINKVVRFRSIGKNNFRIFINKTGHIKNLMTKIRNKPKGMIRLLIESINLNESKEVVGCDKVLIWAIARHVFMKDGRKFSTKSKGNVVTITRIK